MPILGGIFTAIAETAGAIVPEAAAAEVAAAPAEIGAVAGTVLPEIVVEGAAPAVAGAATEAALGGGAALAGAGAADAALAGGAGLAAAGGLTAAEALAGGGPTIPPSPYISEEFGALAQPTTPSGTIPGVTPTPVQTIPVTPGGLAPSGGVSTPSEALAGTTGPSATFDQRFAPATAQLPNANLPTPSQLASNALGYQAAPFATEPDAPDITATATSPAQAAINTALTGSPPTIGPGAPAPLTVDQGTISSAPAALGAETSNAVPAGTSLTTATGQAPGGGISGTLSSILSSPALRLAGPAASLGMLGYTLAKGQPSLPPAAQQALANVSPGSPLAGVASKNLTEASTGQLQPGELAMIQTSSQNAKNKLYQFYASQGRDPNNDTDYIQGTQQIDTNAQIQYQGFITTAVNNGLAAQGAIDQTLQAAANMQLQNDQAFQSAIMASLQAFGISAALSTVGSRTV